MDVPAKIKKRVIQGSTVTITRDFPAYCLIFLNLLLHFPEAFDSIFHENLVAKLQKHGVTRTFLKWSGSYLKTTSV